MWEGPGGSWPAGRTHVDDGVRLDVVHVRVPQAQLPAVPLGRADDARGHRVLQGEGAADGHHELPRPQVCRVAQQQRRQLFLQGHRGGPGGRLSCPPWTRTGAGHGQAPAGAGQSHRGEGPGKPPTQAKARLASSWPPLDNSDPGWHPRSRGSAPAVPRGVPGWAQGPSQGGRAQVQRGMASEAIEPTGWVVTVPSENLTDAKDTSTPKGPSLMPVVQRSAGALGPSRGPGNLSYGPLDPAQPDLLL